MNIDKIDNGYTVSYEVEDTVDPQKDWAPTTYHKFAFTTWTDLVDWVRKNESIVD